jgi:hypothetical protein
MRPRPTLLSREPLGAPPVAVAGGLAGAAKETRG